METLTENWAVGYLQVVVVLLVFAAGLPALILQIVSRAESLRPLSGYVTGLIFRYLASVVLILTVFAGLFIWCWHPSSQKGGWSNSRPLVTEFFEPPLMDGPSSDSGYHNRAITDCDHFPAGLAITVALVLAVISWLILVLMLTERSMIRYMRSRPFPPFWPRSPSGGWGKRAVRRLKSFSSNWGRRKHKPKANVFEDLIVLGQSMESGRRKELVLDAAERMSEEVQESHAYTGRELTQLLRGFSRILAGKYRPGNVENFEQGVEVLEVVLRRISRRFPQKDLLSILDARLAMRALEKLALAAIANGDYKTAQKIIESVSEDKLALFRIGVTALEAKQYLIADAVRNKLQAQIVRTLPIVGKNAHVLLGFMAHFRGEKGSSRRDRVERFLSMYEDSFSPSFFECLFDAYSYHRMMARFDTADAIAKWIDEIREEDSAQ